MKCYLAIGLAILFCIITTYGQHQSPAYSFDTPRPEVVLPQIAPSFVNTYSALTNANIEYFFEDWARWSLFYMEQQTDSTLLSVCDKVYQYYQDTNKQIVDNQRVKPIILPSYAIVYAYDRDFCLNETDSDFDISDCRSATTFIPYITTSQPILYLTPNIDSLLSRYFGNSPWQGHTKIKTSAYRQLTKRIDVQPAHWSGWHFCSMPVIYEVHRFRDADVVQLRYSWCEGETLCMPHDRNVDYKRIMRWIE